MKKRIKKKIILKLNSAFGLRSCVDIETLSLDVGCNIININKINK